MDGDIYYPYIRLPESAWFSRAVLYWDSVATIVPDQWTADPNKLGSYTLELVQLEVVTQLLSLIRGFGQARYSLHWIHHSP